MTARERQEKVIEDFSFIEDPLERFQVIVETARAENFPEHFRKDEFLVPGCTSRVWLAVWSEDDSLRVGVDSEAPALKGIATLFERIYSDSSKEEISSLEPEFIHRLGIDRQLTPTRRRGVANIRLRLLELIENFDQ